MMNDSINILASSVQAKTKKERIKNTNESIISNNSPSSIIKKAILLNNEIKEDEVSSEIKKEIQILHEIFKNNINHNISDDVKNLKITPFNSKFQYTMGPIPFNVSKDREEFMIYDFEPNVKKLKDYNNLIKDFKEGKKSIYMFDLETMGLNNGFIDDSLNTVQRNNLYDFFAITEASLIKVDKVDGNYKTDVLSSFYSSPTAFKTSDNNGKRINIQADEIIEKLYKESDPTGLVSVTLRRILGYKDNELKDGEAPSVNNVIFKGDTDLSDKEGAKKGVRFLQKLNERGSDKYFDDVAHFVDSIYTIMKNEDIIVTNNGTVFDFTQLIGEMTSWSTKDKEGNIKYAIPEKIRDLQISRGISKDQLFTLDNFKELATKYHTDMLLMSRMISTDITERRVSGEYGGKYSFKMDDLLKEMEFFYSDGEKNKKGLDEFNNKVAQGVSGLGFDDNVIDNIKIHGVSSFQHTGSVDTVVQVAAMEYMHDAYGDIIENKLNDYSDGILLYNDTFNFSNKDDFNKYISLNKITKERLDTLHKVTESIDALNKEFNFNIKSIDDLYSKISYIDNAYKNKVSELENIGAKDLYIEKDNILVPNKDKIAPMIYDSIINFSPKEITKDMTDDEVLSIIKTNSENHYVSEFMSSYSVDDIKEILKNENLINIQGILLNKDNPVSDAERQVLKHLSGFNEMNDVSEVDLLNSNIFIAKDSIPLGEDTFNFIINNNKVMSHPKSHFITKDNPYKITISKASDIKVGDNNLVDLFNLNSSLTTVDNKHVLNATSKFILNNDTYVVQLEDLSNSNNGKISYALFSDINDLNEGFLNKGYFKNQVMSTAQELSSYLHQHDLDNIKNLDRYVTSQYVSDLSISTIKNALDILDSNVDDTYHILNSSKSIKHILSDNTPQPFKAYDLIKEYISNPSSNNSKREELFDNLKIPRKTPLTERTQIKTLFGNSYESFIFFNDNIVKGDIDAVRELFARNVLVPLGDTEDEINNIKSIIFGKGSSYNDIIEAMFNIDKDLSGNIKVSSNFTLNSAYQTKGFSKSDVLSDMNKARYLKINSSLLKYTQHAKKYLEPNKEVLKSLVDLISTKYGEKSFQAIADRMTNESITELNKTRSIQYVRAIRQIKSDFIDTLSDDDIFFHLENIDQKFEEESNLALIKYNDMIKSELKRVYGINDIKESTPEMIDDIKNLLEQEGNTTLNDLKKDAFYKVYNAHYDFASGKNILIDKLTDIEYANNNIKNLNRVSIISFDNKANKVLDINGKEDLARQLFSTINTQFYTKDNSDTEKRLIKNKYVKSIGDDLLKRGIISNKDYSALLKILDEKNIQSASEHLSNSIINQKNKIIDMVNSDLNSGFSLLTDDEKVIRYKDTLKSNKYYNDVSKFVDNLVDKESTGYQMYSVVGNNLNDMVYKILKNKGEITDDISSEDINKYVKSILDNDSVINDDTLIIDVYKGRDHAIHNANQLAENVGKKLGWSNEHKKQFSSMLDTFIFNKRVEINSYGDKVNPGFMVFERNDNMYLAITRDNLSLYEDIGQRYDISQLKEKHVVVKLPKIHDDNGVKYIEQSKFSQKGMTKTLHASLTEDGSIKYKLKDTVSDFLQDMSDSMYYSVEQLMKMKPREANYRINKAWRNINESKSLTSSTYQQMIKALDDGSIHVVTDFVRGMNINDLHKSNNVFIKTLMLKMGDALDYASNMSVEYVDTKNGRVLKDENLHKLVDDYKKSMSYSSNSVDKDPIQTLKNTIDNIKEDIRLNQNHKYNSVLKSELFESFADNSANKIFFFEKIEEFADILLRMHNEKKSEQFDKEVVDILEHLKNYGRYSVINLKPNEAKKGLINPTVHEDIGLPSDIGNIIRNEVNVQGTSTKPISVENVLANKVLLDDINKIDDLDNIKVKDIFNEIGVTPGRSAIIGESFHQWNEKKFIENINSKDKSITGVDGYKHGFESFVAKFKHMTANDLINTIESIRTEQGDFSLVRSSIKESIINEFGLSSDEFDSYFDRSLKRIMMSSSLYEDGRMGHVNLLYLKNPTSVKTYRVKDISYNEIIPNVNRKFKVGDVISSNVVLGVNKEGVDVKSKLTGEITSILRNDDGDFEIQVRNIDAENTMKINLNASERGITTVPRIQGKDKRETSIFRSIISKVQDSFFDGALILANPDAIKHNASEIAITSRLIGISKSISNDNEMNEINKILSEAKAGNMKIYKSSNASDLLGEDSYILTYTTKGKFNDDIHNYGIDDDILMIEKKIGEHKDLQNVYSKINKLNKEHDNRVFLANMSNASLNAINSTKTDIGSEKTGSSFTFRRITAMSDIIAHEEGMLKSGYGLSQNLIDRSVQNWLKGFYKSNKEGIREVQNILYAFQSHISPSSIKHNIKVKEIQLDDFIADARHIDEVLSDLFNQNNSPNLLSIDISNLSIQNPFYVSNNHQLYNTLKKEFGDIFDEDTLGQKYIKTLYIPNTKANVIGDYVSLNRIQKSAADIIGTLQELNGRKNTSTDVLQKKAIKQFEKYIESHVFELTNKDGKAKSLFKTKEVPLSGRSLNQIVIAPHYTDSKNKILKSSYFGNLVDIDEFGNRALYKVTHINPQEFLDKTGFKSFSNLGKEIIKERHASNFSRQIDIINNALAKYNINETVSNLEEAKKLFKNGIIKDNVLEDIGYNFMEQIGLENSFHRAPSIKPESDSYTMYRIHEGVSYGMFGTDAFTAKYAKLDTDGDNGDINIGISVTLDENGKPKLRSFDDSVRVLARKGAVVTSNRAFQTYDDLVYGQKSHNVKNVYKMEEFIKESVGYKLLKERNISSNVYNAPVFLQGISTLHSKDAIGQASNPGFFLKAAAEEHVLQLYKQGKSMEALQIKNTVVLGAFLVEQSSIDQKKINAADLGISDELDESVRKGVYSNIKKAKKMQRVYDNIYKAVRHNKTSDELIYAVSDLLEVMQEHVSEGKLVKVNNKNIPIFNGREVNGEKLIWQDGIKPQTREEFLQKARQIIDGNITRSDAYRASTIESFVYDTINVFKDDNAAKTYASMLVSTYNRNLRDVGSGGKKILTLFETISSYQNESESGPGIASIIDAGNLSDEVTFNVLDYDKKTSSTFELTYNNPLKKAVVTKGNHHISKGVYDVYLSSFRNGMHSVEFFNTLDGSSHNIYAKTIEEINEMINSMDIQTNISTDEKIGYLDNYLDSVSKNKVGIDNFKRFVNKITDPYWSEASSVAFPLDNVSDKSKEPITQIREAVSKRIAPMFKKHKDDAFVQSNINAFINGMVNSNFIDYSVDENGNSFITELRNQINDGIIKRAKEKEFNPKNVNQYIADIIYDKNNKSLSFLHENLSASAVNFGSLKFVDDKIKSGMSKNATNVLDNLMDVSTLSDIKKEDINKISDLMVLKLFNYDSLDDSSLSENKDRLITDLRQEHSDMISDRIEKIYNIDFEGRKNKAIIDVINFSHDRNFRHGVASLNDSSDLEDLTIAWKKDYVLTKAKHLTNEELKILLHTSSDLDGINDDFVLDIKRQISTYLKYREDRNLDSQARLVDEMLDDIVESVKNDSILDEINQDIVKRGMSGRNDVNIDNLFDNSSTINKDSVKDFMNKGKKFFDKNKTAIGVGALLGLGIVGVMGYNIRNNTNALKSREDEDKVKHSKKQTSVPISNKIYVNDDSHINVNVRARGPIGKSMQDSTSAVMSAFGDNVDFNTSYSDDRSEISYDEVDKIMSDAINLY